MEDIWFLKEIDWLREVEDDEWEALHARATRHEFRARETVFLPTPDPHSVYLLESGQVRIYRLSRDGDEATLGYVAPGEVFGELPGFGDYERESFAVAQQDCIVWKIPVDIFRALMQARPNLALAVTRVVGRRLKRVEARVESLAFRDVRSRLASVLLELVEDFGESDASGRCTLDLRLSQEDLAKLIGASRQSVNVALSRLADESLVTRVDGHLCLPDPERLRNVVEAGR